VEDADPPPAIWSAAAAGTTAWAPEAPGRLSLFTEAALAGLAGSSQTRTLGDVHAAVRENMERRERDMGLSRPSHPTLAPGADTVAVAEYRRGR
jgi:hypothetical protein